MKSSTRHFLIALSLILIVLGGGYWRSVSGRAGTVQELRQLHLPMADYLLTHDHRWPQPGDADAAIWWRSGKTDRMAGTFEIAQFDPTPNMAFFDSTKPWLTYTAKDGIRYEVLPDGRVDVTQP
jgi:hypothetical protein